MNLSELQKKEIINISDGKKIGMIIDVIVSSQGKIDSLILEEKRFNKRFSKGEIKVNWEQIVKIGDDIILIDTKKL